MIGSPVDVGTSMTRTLTATSSALEKGIKLALADAGRTCRKELMVTAQIVPGADRKFSRFKGKGLGVRTRADKAGAEVVVIPTGPWKIAEEGAAPHGGHPGTRAKQGKRAWSKGRDRALGIAEQDVPEQIIAEVERGFGG